MNVLMVGDIVARPGRRVLVDNLAKIQCQHEIDFTVVNIENAAGGFGITRKILQEFHDLPIDVMTSGNHIWDKREALEFIDMHPDLLRPHNYPANTPGSGWFIKNAGNGLRIGVVSEAVDVVLVDFHAEATSEKIAMGWHLDGRVTAVVGTHTHVPTADERVLPGGTAYITDLGMTGCYDSVIGSNTEAVLQRMVHKMQIRLEPATGKADLCGVLIDVNESTGLARSIERIRVKQD